MATVSSLMTAEELLALPDDGPERWLIAGELRERPMTLRNRFHSRATIRIGKFLDNWLDDQPEPRGQILGGEAGIILRRNPDSTVGVDITYVGVDGMIRQAGSSTLIEGIPALGVEILSPSDTIEDINEKIDAYLEVRVPIVWIIDPFRRTVTVYQPEAEPRLYNVHDELTAEPHLPGFRVPVARLFE